MVPARGASTRARRLGIATAGAAVAVLGVGVTVWLSRLALAVFATAADANTAELLTALSAAACAAVTARLTLSFLLVALASALQPGTTVHRRGRAVALAVSPRWIRPAVALLLATGVSVAAGGCTVSTSLPGAAAEAVDASRAPPTIGSAPRGVGSLPALGSATGAGPVADAAATASPAASSASPPQPEWWERSALPDPLWMALPEPGWVPSTPPPAPVLPAADAALVTSGAQHADGPLPRAARTADDSVVVRRGDSLWSITARQLGPGASDAEVAAEWPRWWHANRAVIGPDPDFLLPGTRLRPPRPDDDPAFNHTN